MAKTRVYLSLGSNMGDRDANLGRALELLKEQVRIDRVSPVYETAPVGNTRQPRFLNLACRGRTTLAPPYLLAFAKSIEKRMGRKPGPPNSPRPVDVDILFYGSQVLDSPELKIPHPRLQERAFVLKPLADIAPRLKHPVSGKTVTRMLRELAISPGDIHKVEET